jgi:hypothetical protein
VNLEDFKSFRRVLKPSGVGSIPTHSRQLDGGFATRLALCVLGVLGVALGALPARATEAVPEGTPGPFARAVRSAVVPAWGQITNGKSKKAAVLMTVQAYVFTRLIEEHREAHESQRRVDALADRTDAEGLALAEIAKDSAQEHFDRRRDMLFWALIGAFYGAVDAYVDAHLGNFERELEEDRELFGAVDPAERRVEVGVRF